MAKIDISQFKGMIPKIDDRFLPPGNSVECVNADLDRGSLSPVKDVSLVTDLGAGPYRKFYKQDDQWIVWASDVDVVKAEIVDSDHRIFYTGDGYPKQTNYTLQGSGINRRLGVVPPALPLSIVVAGTGSGTVEKTVSYVYTYVDSFNEESYPSDPTAVINVEEGQYLYLTGFVVPEIAENGNEITHIRLYRIEATGDGGADYMMIGCRPGALDTAEVQDIPVAQIVSTSTPVYDANDQLDPTGLTESVYETIPSDEWVHPPDTAHSLIQFSNGILACADKNEVLVSEPLIPYGYPLGNRNVTQHDIVGLGVFRESLIIPTKGQPYALHGSDPATMMFERLSYRQACLSKRGILSTDVGVFYPSPDGMFLIDNAQGMLATDHLITKNQWASDYYPSNLLAFEYEGDLYGFNIGTNTGFMFDLATREYIRKIEINSKYKIYDALYDAVTDLFYLLVENTVTSTYQIITLYSDDNHNLDYTWKSGVTSFPVPLNLSTCRVLGDIGAGVDVRIYADGNLVRSKYVTDDRIFRVKSGFRAKDWQIELVGQATVVSAILATSVQELTNGS